MVVLQGGYVQDYFLAGCTSPSSLHLLYLCHALVMLGQEASDGSMTPLTWHLLLKPSHPPSLPLSSSQSDPQCPFCLTLIGCRTWVGK